jgi:hypothetical protein
MPYIPTVWADEIPASSPIKYKITDDSLGVVANSAKIEILTSVTTGTPINATNLNKMEAAIALAVSTAEAAILAATAAEIASRIPVGWLIESTTPTNPAITLGYGTWESYGAGRVTVGVGTSDQEFTAGAEGGKSSVALDISQMPNHGHLQNAHNHAQDAHLHGGIQDGGAFSAASGAAYNGTIHHSYEISTAPATATNQAATATNQNTGGNAAHENLQPFIVVYRWRRTA